MSYSVSLQSRFDLTICKDNEIPQNYQTKKSFSKDFADFKTGFADFETDFADFESQLKGKRSRMSHCHFPHPTHQFVPHWGQNTS